MATDLKVTDQFGWTPLSVIEPTKESKFKWDIAYIEQLKSEQRRSDDAEYLTGLGMSEFHAGLAEGIVRYWSLPGSRVVDPFMGRATRAVVSAVLERDYYGFEISPITYKRVVDHTNKLELSVTLYNSDGCLMSEVEDNFADLVMTCPPYWNIEKYESVDGQLSDCKSYESFLTNIDTCSRNIYRVLRSGAFCCWVCADFRDTRGAGLLPFHNDTINIFTKNGLLLHDIIIIKNFSPFAALQAGKVAAKRYTSKIHEYLLVFRKPGEYVVPDYCRQNDNVTKAANFFSWS